MIRVSIYPYRKLPNAHKILVSPKVGRINIDMSKSIPDINGIGNVLNTDYKVYRFVWVGTVALV